MVEAALWILYAPGYERKRSNVDDDFETRPGNAGPASEDIARPGLV